jgi:hypothetical protein
MGTEVNLKQLWPKRGMGAGTARHATPPARACHKTLTDSLCTRSGKLAQRPDDRAPFSPEVPLRHLSETKSEKKLNLVRYASVMIAQPVTCAAQIAGLAISNEKSPSVYLCARGYASERALRTVGDPFEH